MTSGIAVHDITATQWSLSGPTGLRQQNIRSFGAACRRWFGGVRFKPPSRWGIHRHFGPGAGFMPSGPPVDHAIRMRVASR